MERGSAAVVHREGGHLSQICKRPSAYRKVCVLRMKYPQQTFVHVTLGKQPMSVLSAQIASINTAIVGFSVAKAKLLILTMENEKRIRMQLFAVDSVQLS